MGWYQELCRCVLSPVCLCLRGADCCAARNNLRAMKKGDLAFFYHSNCKVPGIVGTMEIVEEHSPDCKWNYINIRFISHPETACEAVEQQFFCTDGSRKLGVLNQGSLHLAICILQAWTDNFTIVTARDPSEPYYDPKDKGDEPRWSVVHVEFRQKFDQKITLVDLKEWHKVGQPLENMQMLNSARLSVSKVSKDEWEFLVGVVEERKAAGGKED